MLTLAVGLAKDSSGLRLRYVDSRPYSITHGYVYRVAHDSDDRLWRSFYDFNRFSYRVPVG